MSLRIVQQKTFNNEQHFNIDLSCFQNKVYEDPLFDKSNKNVRLNDVLFRGNFNFENFRTDEGELVLKFTDQISNSSVFLYFDNISEVMEFSKKVQSNMEFSTYGVNQFDVISLIKDRFLYRRKLSENEFIKMIQNKLNTLKNALR